MMFREITFRAFVVLLTVFGSHQVVAGEREDKAARAFSECDWEAEKVLVIYRIEYESSRRGQSEDKTMAALTKRERTLSKRLSKREPSASEKKAAADLKERRSEQLEQSNLRESRVRNQLIDKCMRAKGLSFVPTCDPQLPSAPDRSYFDSDPTCWK
jgi:hypothetical protein